MHTDSIFDQMRDTLGMHLKCPEVGLSTYRRINKIELAHRVMTKYRVYLDTKYWIRFRDLLLGRNNDSSDAKLYNLLSKACREASLICPVSYSAIAELLNQQDEHTRLTTARLMDELSDNVCLERPDYLFANEVDWFLSQQLSINADECTPSDLAWTRPAFFVGQGTLVTDALSGEQTLAMQKCIDDSMAWLNIEQLIGRLGGSPRMTSGHRHSYTKDLTQQTSDTLNREKVKPENRLPSFSDYVLSEVIGIADGMKNLLAPVMERAMHRTGCTKQLNQAENAIGAELLKRLLANAYRFGKLREQVPQLHIWASLHALVRYDQKRAYKNGDYEDFRHAGSAIPYCDVFLTERSLAHMLKHPPAAINQSFGCAVFAKSAEASSYVGQLLDGA
jgi:hypothetical protein